MKLPLLLLFFSLILHVSCTSISSVSPDYDDTHYLQSLLDAEEPVTRIPAGVRPWSSRPLTISTSDKTIVFEEGCVIRAVKDAYYDAGDSLLTIQAAQNLTLEGNGAVLQMNRKDYRRLPWKKGEWRHGIAIHESENITISGLVIKDTGGDGVYIGQRRDAAVCRNIVLRNLLLENNYRQGVSVISVHGFLMEGCTVRGTKGTPPAAGIDFEPNGGVYGLVDCVIRSCTFTHNAGPGILVYLAKMTADQIPVSIRVENTRSRRNFFFAAVYAVPKGVTGTVEFINCDLSFWKYIKVPEGFQVSLRKE